MSINADLPYGNSLTFDSDRSIRRAIFRGKEPSISFLLLSILKCFNLSWTSACARIQKRRGRFKTNQISNYSHFSEQGETCTVWEMDSNIIFVKFRNNTENLRWRFFNTFILIPFSQSSEIKDDTYVSTHSFFIGRYTSLPRNSIKKIFSRHS